MLSLRVPVLLLLLLLLLRAVSASGRRGGAASRGHVAGAQAASTRASMDFASTDNECSSGDIALLPWRTRPASSSTPWQMAKFAGAASAAYRQASAILVVAMRAASSAPVADSPDRAQAPHDCRHSACMKPGLFLHSPA